MKKLFITFCLIVYLTSACEGKNVTTTQATITLHVTEAATQVPTTQSTPTTTSIPTNTPRPPISVDFYHLRIEYRNTSDWASLEFIPPENILSVRQIDLSCSNQACSPDTISSITRQSISIYHPLSILSTEPSMTLTVDLAISPESVVTPFRILSKHGAVNGTGIRVLYLAQGEWILLREANHYWVDQSNPDTSATHFYLDFASLLINPDALQHGVISRPDKLVLAYYYPWFPDYGWSDTTPMSDKPLISISSSDPENVAWQIDQAKSAGIDGFIESFNGDWSDDRTRILLNVAEENDFKISFLLETLNSGGPPWPPETLENWIERAYNEFSNSPAYLKLNGEPVMFIYCSNAVPLQTWHDMFTRLRNKNKNFLYIGMGYDLANLSVFDGIHNYGIYGYEDLVSTYLNVSQGIRYYQLLALAGTEVPKISVATISPGFDSTPYGSSTFTVARGDGQYYQSSIDAAIESDPDWIVITSWNEYGENTHIEPSERDGHTFSYITREFTQRWKNMILSP